MLLTVLLLLLVTNKVSSECRWSDLKTGLVLDLRLLSNITLHATDEFLFSTTNDIFSHTAFAPMNEYIYSPCRNAVTCDGRNVMVNQAPIDDPSECNVIATYNETVYPKYIKEHGIDTWTFEYANGETDCGDPARTWVPTFICDKNKVAEISDVIQIYGSCYYMVEILTKYACVSQNSTLPPQNDCIWRQGEHILNLTVLSEHILSKVSDNNPSRAYSISPCGNYIDCVNNFGMITVGNGTSESDCELTIAKWDKGLTQPKYDNNFNGQWQFIYANDESCNKKPENIVSVVWNCNTLGGTGTITSAQQKDYCMFEIQIDSKLACNNNNS